MRTPENAPEKISAKVVRTAESVSTPTPAPAPRNVPILSPGYVKATIADLTVSRRELGQRLDRLLLFKEHGPRSTDPPEVQLLFAARDDYLSAPNPAARAQALSAMSRLLADARQGGADVAKEMNRLLIAAMQAETAQKKLDVVRELAERKMARVPDRPTLADLLREEPRGTAEPESLSGPGEGLETPAAEAIESRPPDP